MSLGINTLTVHDVYRCHPHHAQVMAPSIQALLVNSKKLKLTKCSLSGLRWWTTYTPTFTFCLKALVHNGMEHLSHFCAGKEYDVYRRLFNFCKVT